MRRMFTRHSGARQGGGEGGQMGGRERQLFVCEYLYTVKRLIKRNREESVSFTETGRPTQWCSGLALPPHSKKLTGSNLKPFVSLKVLPSMINQFIKLDRSEFNQSVQ